MPVGNTQKGFPVVVSTSNSIQTSQSSDQSSGEKLYQPVVYFQTEYTVVYTQVQETPLH